MTPATRKTTPLPWLKPAVLAGSLLPLIVMAIRAANNQLGANPIGEVLNKLGLLALIFVIAALVCSPLKILFGWTWPLRIRRMLGVLGFVYAALHVATYAGLDQVFDWGAIYDDVTKRKFIFVGFAAFVLLVPLAVTSTNGAVKRMGFVRWKQLHRLAYVAPILGVVHFVWRVKKDLSEPLVYGAVLTLLLVSRIVVAASSSAKKIRPS